MGQWKKHPSEKDWLDDIHPTGGSKNALGFSKRKEQMTIASKHLNQPADSTI